MGEGSLGQARGGKSNEREAVMRESKHPLQRGSRTKACVCGASSSLKARKGATLHRYGRIKARRSAGWAVTAGMESAVGG